MTLVQFPLTTKSKERVAEAEIRKNEQMQVILNVLTKHVQVAMKMKIGPDRPGWVTFQIGGIVCTIQNNVREMYGRVHRSPFPGEEADFQMLLRPQISITLKEKKALEERFLFAEWVFHGDRAKATTLFIQGAKEKAVELNGRKSS